MTKMQEVFAWIDSLDIGVEFSVNDIPGHDPHGPISDLNGEFRGIASARRYGLIEPCGYYHEGCNHGHVYRRVAA